MRLCNELTGSVIEGECAINAVRGDRRFNIFIIDPINETAERNATGNSEKGVTEA